VEKYKASGPKEELNTNVADLTNSVVSKYLSNAAPETAEDFSRLFPVQEVTHTLENVVSHYRKIKLKGSRRKVENRRMYTREEDNVILEHLAECAGKINFKRLAEDLGRTNGSVNARVKRLQVNAFSKGKVKKITDIERQIIVEKVLDKILVGSKLSDPKILSCHEWKELSEQFSHRTWTQIEFHWMEAMQPCLLQYFSGTRNLPVANMLVSYIADTYGDSDIDWEHMSKRPEFAGHTPFSLRLLFFRLKMATATKYNVGKDDLQIAHVTKFVSERKTFVSKNKGILQSNLIEYFLNRVSELGVKDLFSKDSHTL